MVINWVLTMLYIVSTINGVGVMILSQQHAIKKLSIPLLQNLILEKGFESCLVEISENNFTFVLGCIFRLPMPGLLDSFLSKF